MKVKIFKKVSLALCICLFQMTFSMIRAVEPLPMFWELKTFVAGPSEMFVHEDKCYFAAASDKASNVELWTGDGLLGKAVMLRDINAGDEGSFPKGFIYSPARGYIYFIADDGKSGEEVWAVNPDTGAPWRFVDLNVIPGEGANPRYLAPELENYYNLKDFFCAASYAPSPESVPQQEIVFVYGTTSWMKDIRPGDEGSSPRDITVGRRFYPGTPEYSSGRGWYSAYFFSADDGVHGREFYRLNMWHNGYNADLVDIRSGSESSLPANFTSSGNYMFFTADNGTNGRELWVDTGHGGQVKKVRDINPGSSSSSPSDLVSAADGLIYFSAFSETSGNELWKSNGTEADTVLIRDVYPGTTGSFPDYLCMVGDALFFSAIDGVNGVELWKSDGTEDGTVMVKDIRPGNAGSNPQHICEMGEKCYFTCDSDGNGIRELWVSDGTEEGTVALMTGFVGNASPRQLTPGDSLLYFTADNTLMVYNPNGMKPPAAPSNLRLLYPKTGLLRFQWDDNSADEDGFAMYFGYGFATPDHVRNVGGTAISDNSYFFDDLSYNSPYSFSLRSYKNPNPDKIYIKSLSQWPEPAYITKWTLSPMPSDIAGTWFAEAWTNKTEIFFDALATIWGEGGVGKYLYAWNTNPTHTFTGSETQWTGGQITVTIPGSGMYYIHVQSLNNVGAPNPDILSMGPYLIDHNPPSAPPTPVGYIPTVPDIRFNWEEAEDTGGSGIASYDCQVGTTPGGNDVLDKNVGHDFSATITATPGSTYYARVRAIDEAGNNGPWSANSEGVPASGDAGSLKVSITPAMAVISGASWRRAGTSEWLASGVTEDNVPTGVQVVEFKEINTWKTPADRTVTIVKDKVALESVTYVRSGSLQVTILPEQAVTAGAKWRWSTAFQTSDWFNSGEKQAMSVGFDGVDYFNVEFKDLSAWTPPPTIPWVEVRMGQLTSLEGENTTYKGATGAIRVNLSPQEAVDAGAQWKRASSDTWLNSGEVDAGVPVGKPTITFRDIPNWNSPDNLWVSVNKGTTTTLSGGAATYTTYAGSLTVNITPDAANSGGAQWRRTSNETWNNSGDTESKVSVGNHTVEFQTVNGWVRPDNENVTIENGIDTVLNVEYAMPTELSGKVINHVLKRILLDPTLFIPADANSDGIINSADIITLLEKGL